MDKQESGFRVIVTLVLISFLAALLLAYMNKITREPIARNVRNETLKAVKIVLKPLGKITFPPTAKTIRLKDFTARYYPAFGPDSAIVGYAFIVKAPNGFGGDFDLMVGVDSSGKVTDTYVLNHKETPGLGDNMRKEDFKKQFRGRTLTNTRWKVKKDGGDIDALTAATITSRAFTYGVERALLAFKKLRER